MALTEIYVDPSIATDSGAGTIGDPYGDLEYAIEQETFDTTNGTRINVKAGTDEVLAASLSTALADTSVSVAWVPSATAPLVIQGYTSTAGDGGIGGISGGGSVPVISGANYNGVMFVDMHLHNTGSNSVADVNDNCSFINCEIDTTAAGVFQGIDIDNYGTIINCYIHNVGDNCINTGGVVYVSGCVLDVSDTAGNVGVQLLGGSVNRCIIILPQNSNTVGMNIQNGCVADGNSIVVKGAGGTGAGISITNSRHASAISNNLIEGFSGTGGIGIDMDGTGVGVAYLDGNSFYNCSTNITSQTVAWSAGRSSNEALSASPFTSVATNDFSPVDTGNVKEGYLPNSFPTI